MDKERKKQLIELLTEWFNDTDFSKYYVLRNDEVAKLLKDRLTKLNFWKKRRNKGISEKSLSNLSRGKFITPKCQDCNRIMIRHKVSNKFYCDNCEWL
jgi:ribosomal protein S27E